MERLKFSIPGIYSITNITNGKRYVGSTTNLYRRRQQHLSYLKNNKHVNKYLQNAWNKYGEDSFTFEILLDCELEDVRLFEQRAIDLLKPEYNICPNAGSSIGRVFTEQHKEKLSLAKKNKPNKHGLRYIGLSVKSPLGKSFTIKDCLKCFCERHRLDHSDFSKMLRGLKAHSKGWTL